MENHAITNAQGWLSSIREMVEALAAAEESGDDNAIDEAREAIEQSPLSVEVRSGWHLPGRDDASATEYRILLTTGGPALQIVGDLGDYGEPYREPKLQWQDWGTPWTDYPLDSDEGDAVMTFARQFYFGE